MTARAERSARDGQVIAEAILDSTPSLVRAHASRCDLAGWNSRQSGTRQARLVLVVSEVCAS
jgi:hypothetical protein